MASNQCLIKLRFYRYIEQWHEKISFDRSSTKSRRKSNWNATNTFFSSFAKWKFNEWFVLLFCHFQFFELISKRVDVKMEINGIFDGTVVDYYYGYVCMLCGPFHSDHKSFCVSFSIELWNICKYLIRIRT